MQIASDPVDVQDLQFKLQCRLKVFDRTEGQPIKHTTNLVAAASRYGLIFVGCNSAKLKVLRFASIEDYPSSDAVGNYSRREVTLPSVPQHISVNCDQTKLAVVIERDNCPVALFYDVKSFVSQNITLINEVRLSTTPNVKVSGANWHPTMENIFTECKTDGTLGVYELKGNGVDINNLPAEANVTCFCWSPKGKQIAVGSKDGKLTHYKPDLKAVKVINAPSFEKAYSIISLQWISNYQFIGVFEPLDKSDDQCCLVLIDAPKTGNPTFTNFYDVCYSNGNYRSPQFYLLFEQLWNIIIVSSANSMEIGVLASKGESWIQYTLPDTARAELPLDENREETYPLGLAIDTSSVKPIPWGESTLQPAPSLLLLSHQGVLCSFKIINLKEGIPSINSPPENIADLSGLGAFTTGAVLKPTVDVPKAEPQFSIQPPQQQAPAQNPQAQKETGSLFSSTTSPPQFSFLTPQVTIQPIQKPALPVQPQPQVSGTSTSLFGPQISGPPNGNANNTSTSLIGSMLLNSGNNVSTSSSVASFAATQPTQQFSFSSIGQPQPTAAAPSNETASRSETQPAPTPVQLEPQETNEEMEEILKQMIQMEMSALEEEVQIILEGKNIQTDFNPADIEVILNNTKDIENFVKEVVETSDSQKSEIHILKQNTLQTWAWYEEAISKYKDSQNEDLKALWKIRPLDSVSEKHLATMKQMEYYLNSQLKQAHRALDEQWDDFQDFCRNVTRTPMPTMETIFQTLVKQNVILQRQEYNLKEIQRQVKARKKKSADILSSADANDNLEISMQKMKLDAEDIHRIYQQRVLKRFKPPPVEVTNRLKEILLSREIPHVTAKSQGASIILQTPPQHRFKTVQQQMTPDLRNTEAKRNLSFFQSTPIEIKPEHPGTTAQIPSTPLSAFASTSNVLPSKYDPGENLTSKIATLSTNEPVATPGPSFSEPGPSNQTKTGINFGGFGKETSIPSSNQTFGIQAQNQFTTSKPGTANITGAAGIFSSFNKQLTPEATAGSSISNPTLSFGNSGIALGSSDSSAKPPGTNIASFFSKPSSSNASADLTQSTKGSFFTPITSIQPNSSTQQSAMSSNSSKISAFAPITTVGDSKPTPLTTSVASSPGFSFGLGKSQVVSSANSAAPPGTIPSTSTSAPQKSSPFSIANIISVSSPTLGVPSTTASTSSIFGTAAAPTAGFSFATVSQSTGTTRPLFGSGSSQISSTTSTTTTITNSTSNLLGTVSSTTTTASTSTTATKPGGIFSSVQPQTSTGTVNIFKADSVPSSSTPSMSELASTGNTSSGLNASSTSSLGSIFGTSSSASLSTPSTISGTSVSMSAISGSTFGKTATVESNTSSAGTLASKASSSSLVSSAAASTSASGSGQLFGTTSSTTTSSSSFGTTTSSTASSGSIFGAGTSSTSASSSLFGLTSSSGSIFGKATSATTTSSSLFGSTNSSGSIFGKATTPMTASSSLFGSTTSSGSIFGKATTTTTASSSLFGSTSSSGSIFGKATPSTTTSTSVFGATTPSKGTSLFGSTTASTTSSGSVVGSVVASTTSTGSIFGTASSGSIFGSAVAATSSSGPLFGTAAPSTTSSGSIFGTAASSTSSVPGTSKVFGAVAPTSTSTGSMFGAATPETTKSVFGSASTSSQSVFGTPATSSPFAATSSFGATTTTTSSSSIFGSATSFGGGTSAFGSVSSASSPFGAATNSAPTFGGAAAFGSPSTSSASPFGSSPFGTTATAASPFGAATTSAVSPFGNTPTSAASPFGAASNSSPFEASTSPFVKSPAFGQSSGFGSTFGATPATSSSIFGQAASGTSNSIFGNSSTSAFGGTNTTTSTFGNTTSPFGTASSSGVSSPFGQPASSGGFFGSSQSVFGSSNNTESPGTSFGFGSLNVGASTQSPFAKTTETKSPFGPSTFIATSSSGSLFGSSTFGNASSGGSVFGQSAFGGNTFGNNQQTSGPFSAGSGSVSQSGFGSSPAFQKSSGFGAQPAFGGSPAFGSAPSFGGSPSFGGNASFGSTNKVFGSPNTSGVFGSNTQQQQQAPAFGNMSNQNTIGFGNLVQQSPNSGQNAPFSGNSSFSSWR